MGGNGFQNKITHEFILARDEGLPPQSVLKKCRLMRLYYSCLKKEILGDLI